MWLEPDAEFQLDPAPVGFTGQLGRDGTLRFTLPAGVDQAALMLTTTLRSEIEYYERIHISRDGTAHAAPGESLGFLLGEGQVTVVLPNDLADEVDSEVPIQIAINDRKPFTTRLSGSLASFSIPADERGLRIRITAFTTDGRQVRTTVVVDRRRSRSQS